MRSKTAILLLILASILITAGCDGIYGSSNASSAQNSTVQITMGDAPGDAVVSFSVSVDSIVLTNSSGATVTVLAEPTSVELTHLAGTTTPISTVEIPQGTYTRVAIAVSSPTTTFVHPVSGNMIERTLQLSVTRIIQLDPPLELGGTAVNLNLDLSVAESVSVDSSGNVSFNPRFLVRHGRINSGFVPPRVRPIVGRVEAVSGNTFTLGVRFGQATIRIHTNTETEFVGVSGIGALTPGTIVGVIARFGTDGALLAKKVTSMPLPAALGLEGLVKTTTGLPATQFTLIAHNGIGGLPPWIAGRTLNVNVGGSTVFRIDSDGLDLGALPFAAAFNAESLSPGQAVEVNAPPPSAVVSEDSLSSLLLNASHVTLQAQPVAGQVAGFSGSNNFTLVLPEFSAMARLTGTTSLPVFMQTGKTALAGPVSGGSVTLQNGARVIVRGLLFVDGGRYKLAATHVQLPE